MNARCANKIGTATFRVVTGGSAILAILLAGLSGCTRTETNGEQLALSEFIIEIDQGDQQTEVTAQGAAGDTVLQLMIAAGLKFEHAGAGDQTFVKSINGAANNQEKNQYWVYFVNGELAKIGCGSYKVKEGDRILWKLQASPF